MKREFLADLGLEKELIDKIMAENGKDIATEKEKTAFAEKSLTELQATLDSANEAIKGFKSKDLDVEKAQALAKEWEDKYRVAEKARAEEAKNNALMKELAKSGTVDADLVRTCLNMDEIIIKDGKVIGLEDQLTLIKENKPYLFKGEEKPTIQGGHIGEPGDVSPGGEPVDLNKMTYSEMIEYFNRNPEAAAILEQ